MAAKLYHSPRRLTELVTCGVEFATSSRRMSGQHADGAEGLQSRAGIPVVPRGRDRIARHAAPRRARARSARHQLEALGPVWRLRDGHWHLVDALCRDAGAQAADPG